MCDTLAATGVATARGGMLFAKNSDRERNEAQALESVPARPAEPGRRTRLTYIEIDDEAATHACLISRPFWMWGAEMGANQHGVVIGNEAMHAIFEANRTRALTGMDLVRLGLERAASAAEAVKVITTLLERHGQGGNCGHHNRFYYQNGFMIADPREAYVLETVGRDWVVERVNVLRTLSNAYSISGPIHAMSAIMEETAKGADGSFDFAKFVNHQRRDEATFGTGRCVRSAELLAPKLRRIDVADLMAVLRDHGVESEGDPDWSPARTLRRTICMHAAEGARRSQSVASMVSDLTGPRAVHWVTATSAPCLSIFKPVVLGLPMPEHGPPPTDRYDPESLWWAHERLHRAALHDFPTAHAMIATERDAIEAGFRRRIDEVILGDEKGLARAVDACWSEAKATETRWTQALLSARRPSRSAIGRPAAIAWSRLNTTAGFPNAR